MAEAVIFQIEDGEFALDLVDKAAVGYLDSWQAPAGKTLDTVVLADYTDTPVDGFRCQVTSGALTATADTTTVDVPATFCNPAKSIPQPGETAYALEASFLQDPVVKAGLSRYLFENDTKEAFFYLGFDGTNPPTAIGRVKLQSATIGGAARSVLTADITLPCSRKPDVEFGTTGDSIIIEGDGTVVTPAVTAVSTPAPASSSSSTPVTV